MEGVSELVCQRYYVTEGTVKVCKHAALFCRGYTTVKGSSNLAFSRVEIDPSIVKCRLNHLVQFNVKFLEDVKQVVSCILCCVLLVVLAHGRKEIIPGKCTFVTERLCLCLQIFSEHGHIFFHCRKECIKRLLLHS